MTKKDRMELETLRNGRKNQLRGIISQLSCETENESILRAIAITLATTQNKALKDERNVYSIIEKGGVALWMEWLQYRKDKMIW